MRRLSILLCLALAGCPPGRPVPHAGFLDAPISAVSAQVAGQVQSIPVREGDVVKKGQLLAQLDARERAAAVTQAEANLDRARESLREAEKNLEAELPTVKGAGADIAQAEATLDEAQENFDRTRRLLEGKAATQQQLDSARARLMESRARVASLTASKAAAQGRVSAAVAAVADSRAAMRSSEAAVALAEVQLAEAQLLSPYDGLVVNRNLEEGEWVAPGTPVVTVEDRGHLWVRLDIEETKLGGLKLGAPATVAVLSVPGRTFGGHVSQIGAEGEFALNRDVKRGRPDLRTFRLRVALDQPAAELRPGMTAEVRLASEAGAEPQR